MQQRAELVFLDGERSGDTVALEQGRTVIGRQVGDLLIEDKEISSIHAIISYERGGWYVMDLGSTNGVFVDEQVKLEARLRDGAVLRFGQTRATFQLPDGEPSGVGSAPDLLAGGVHSDLMTMPHVEPGQTVRHEPSASARTAAAAANANTQPSPALQPETDSGAHSSLAGGISGLTEGPPVQVSLEILEGADAGVVRRFTQESILIGRLNTDLVVRDSDVSRRHTIVEVFDASQVYLRDLNSTNGTFVNGRRVSSIRLRNGDQIRLGRCLLRFSARATYRS